ncbi:hypothetical protein PR048_004450 [Dryococelus australis]|uniref:Uncharacterized protein n=1 Tax=Dryococelus australis TaxID=614101 RepID=A0ABQ9I6J8_9NEOP|nr:hypothetical protein PR048_004450 [Dryococelus australis]
MAPIGGFPRGISRLPHPFNPALLHTHLNHPHRLSRPHDKTQTYDIARSLCANISRQGGNQGGLDVLNMLPSLLKQRIIFIDEFPCVPDAEVDTYERCFTNVAWICESACRGNVVVWANEQVLTMEVLVYGVEAETRKPNTAENREFIDRGFSLACDIVSVVENLSRVAVAERIARSPPHQGEPGSIPGRVHRTFASGNRAGRCRRSALLLGDFPFLPPLHSSAAPYSFQSPSSALKTSLTICCSHNVRTRRCSTDDQSTDAVHTDLEKAITMMPIEMSNRTWRRIELCGVHGGTQMDAYASATDEKLIPRPIFTIYLWYKQGQENFSISVTCRLDSTFLCTLEPQTFVHWLLPQCYLTPGSMRFATEVIGDGASCKGKRNWGRHGEESTMVFVRDPSQHSPGVISGNHGNPESEWPDRELNPRPLMEQRRNERKGGNGRSPRNSANPLTNGIVRHDSHMRTYGSCLGHYCSPHLGQSCAEYGYVGGATSGPAVVPGVCQLFANCLLPSHPTIIRVFGKKVASILGVFCLLHIAHCSKCVGGVCQSIEKITIIIFNTVAIVIIIFNTVAIVIIINAVFRIVFACCILNIKKSRVRLMHGCQLVNTARGTNPYLLLPLLLELKRRIFSISRIWSTGQGQLSVWLRSNFKVNVIWLQDGRQPTWTTENEQRLCSSPDAFVQNTASPRDREVVCWSWCKRRKGRGGGRSVHQTPSARIKFLTDQLSSQTRSPLLRWRPHFNKMLGNFGVLSGRELPAPNRLPAYWAAAILSASMQVTILPISTLVAILSASK